MKIKVVPTNKVLIEVTPRAKGNYGFIHIGGEERTAEEERSLAIKIESDIRRHVDDVEHTYVSQEMNYQDESGREFDSIYDLLSYHFNEDYDPEFVFKYENSDGTGTRSYADSFKNLIEEAFRHSNGFEVVSGDLTAAQKSFLEKVIASGKNRSIQY